MGPAMTTVADLLAARAEDDRIGVHGRRRALDLAPGRRGGRNPRRPGPLPVRRRQAAHRRPAPQRRRVPLLAQRRRPGRCGQGRHQPDPARRGPGRRRAGHRLRHHRDRRRGRRPPARASTSGVDDDKVLSSAPTRYDALLARYAGSRRGPTPHGARRRGRRGRALPPHLHVGDDRRAQGRALHPGPAGRHRRGGGARLRLHRPRTSATAPCRSSTATRSMALWGPAVMVGAAIAHPPALQRLGLHRRRAPLRGHQVQLRGQGHRLHSGHARAARRRRQHAEERLRHRGLGTRPRPLPQALRVLPH